MCEDEVILDCGDGYNDLPEKTRAICRWSIEQGYDTTIKCDDDTYLQAQRALDGGVTSHDYVGRLRGPVGKFPAPYCSGFCYGLSRRAAEVIAAAEIGEHLYEDQFVAQTLLDAGIYAHPDYRYQVITSERNTCSGTEGPRQGNDVIAACEFIPQIMRRVHHDWLTKPSEVTLNVPTGPLSRVCILVKTFLRDGYLLRCLAGIQRTMPDAKIVIVDDGYESSQKIHLYSELRRRGHVCEWLPFDSGFGAKSNRGVELADRDYVLIGSDDFDFGDSAIRGYVEKMVSVLDTLPAVGVASGRVNGRPYEATIDLGESSARERQGYAGEGEVNGIKYLYCDLTVNFSLVRRAVFEKVKWDSDVKIGGGEHGAWFVDLKRAGWKTVYLPGVNINELKGPQQWAHAAYGRYRGRAGAPGRICLKRRGIETYHLMGGQVEHC
jgi:GT2 family glycosyltransferase